ncbi:hypothetical protein ACSYAD_21135 [Acaryochloris marina NIES-2412]|uniref:hypothetical protein n=1 Tax=Acaryochloris marina TaxID=155978 RepID=UPI004058C2BC
MLTSFLAEVLAVSFGNLTLTATMFKCAEEASEELSPEAKQRLALVHTGLAMAIQAMEFDELQQLIKQSEASCDFEEFLAG